VSLLGIDLGTSGVRALAVAEDGTDLAAAARATSLSRPREGRVEVDAEQALAAAVSAVRRVCADPAVVADPVAALSLAVQGEAVVPVDAAGRALAPAPVSMDRRGAATAERVGSALGAAEVQRITGQPLHPMFSLYKIAAEGPNRTGPRVHQYRCLGGFVAARLGAEPVLDTTLAARTGAFDVDRRRWSQPLLEATGVPADLLPTVVPPGTVIGTVAAAAATATGLAAGTPVVVGSHDQAASFWGAGGRAGEVAVFSTGSSDCLTVGTPARPDLAGTGFATYPAAEAGWLTLAGTAAGGWALDWLSTLVGADRAALLAAIPDRPPDLLVLPYLAGSGTLDNDPAARGAVVGLTLQTARDELVRAFLESAGFELAKILDALGGRGITAGGIRTVGGGSAERRVLAVRASAAGIPLTPVPGHSAARGAAFQAGVGIGRFASFEAAPVPPAGPPAVPDPAHARHYAAQRARYRALYPALRRIEPEDPTRKEPS
jgi:sugar (pentulose or hexulose) kinase